MRSWNGPLQFSLEKKVCLGGSVKGGAEAGGCVVIQRSQKKATWMGLHEKTVAFVISLQGLCRREKHLMSTWCPAEAPVWCKWSNCHDLIAGSCGNEWSLFSTECLLCSRQGAPVIWSPSARQRGTETQRRGGGGQASWIGLCLCHWIRREISNVAPSHPPLPVSRGESGRLQVVIHTQAPRCCVFNRCQLGLAETTNWRSACLLCEPCVLHVAYCDALVTTHTFHIIGPEQNFFPGQTFVQLKI